jgi:hypothetical protein
MGVPSEPAIRTLDAGTANTASAQDMRNRVNEQRANSVMTPRK